MGLSLQIQRSKRTTGNFPKFTIIPSNLLKYTRSKQDLRDFEQHTHENKHFGVPTEEEIKTITPETEGLGFLMFRV
jgi:hypothetical protein